MAVEDIKPEKLDYVPKTLVGFKRIIGLVFSIRILRRC